MMRSKRFQPIQDIMARSAEELSRAMAEAAAKLVELERQHEQLRRYRDEYVQKSMIGGGSVDAVRLQNYRSFLDRLGTALRQCEQAVAAARAEHERRRSEWSEKRVEAESLGRVVERYRAEERRAEDAREQHDADETGRRLSARSAA